MGGKPMKKYEVTFVNGTVKTIEAEQYVSRENEFRFLVNVTRTGGFDVVATLPRERVLSVEEKKD